VQQNLEDHLALGDEMTVAAGEIALANVAVRLDTRVERVVNGDYLRHGLTFQTRQYASPARAPSRSECGAGIKIRPDFCGIWDISQAEPGAGQQLGGARLRHNTAGRGA
jgi:hypothetical protein